MSKEKNKEKKGKIAFKFYEELKTNERGRRVLLARNAKLFYEIFEGEYYKDILGDDEGEWAGFLADIGIYYSRNQVINLMECYKKFELNGNIKLTDILDIPISRLVDMLPVHFESEEECQVYLDHARIQIPRDWGITIRERKGLTTEENCEHKFQHYEICSICGLRHKIENHNEKIHK